MRISDLISFIRIATAQNPHASLSERTLVEMARKGFPRRDLLEWFCPTGLAPALYFPALLTAAAYVTARTRGATKVLTAEADLRFAAVAARFVGAAEDHVGLDMRDGAEQVLPGILPGHAAALIAGVFDRACAPQAAVLRLLCAQHWPNAAVLLFFTGDVYRSWRDGDLPPPDGLEVYRGLLQEAVGQEIFVVFRETAARLPARRSQGA